MNTECKNVRNIKVIAIGYIVINTGIEILINCVNPIFATSVLKTDKIIAIFCKKSLEIIYEKKEQAVISPTLVIKHATIIITPKKIAPYEPK